MFGAHRRSVVEPVEGPSSRRVEHGDVVRGGRSHFHFARPRAVQTIDYYARRRCRRDDHAAAMFART